MESKAPAFSLRDLESGAKNLHAVHVAPQKDDKRAGDGDEQALRTLGNSIRSLGGVKFFNEPCPLLPS